MTLLFPFKMNNKKFSLFLVAFFWIVTVWAGKTDTFFANSFFNGQIGKYAYILIDPDDKMSFYDALNSQQYKKSETEIPNLGSNSGAVWLQFFVKNESQENAFALEIENAFLENVRLYYPDENGYALEIISKDFSFYQRKSDNTNPYFILKIAPGETKRYFLKVKSPTQLLIPLKFGTTAEINVYNLRKNILWGIYYGIIWGFTFYNLFIFLSTKDKSYLYFIFYVISVGLVQMNITGLGYKYLWPNSPHFEKLSLYIFPTLTALSSIAFTRNFLSIKEYLPKINKLFTIINVLYILLTINAFIGSKIISYNLINILGLPLAILLIVSGIYIWFKHRYRPALVFLIAWSIFLLSVIVFVFKDVGILPYNLLTISILQIGSASVIILLSIAIADKMNLYKAEKDAFQQAAFETAKENERIVREQNIILEQNVLERTKELKRSNENLQQTLTELKEAEAQLVESEKMASLGQLTAGIAHEINNPINFVTSNVGPLKRDITTLQEMIVKIEEIGIQNIPAEEKKGLIEDIKTDFDYDYMNTEIEYLLNGIKEGATRTSEIVKGLRVFSRLDEDDVKFADMNECLDSTIVIVNNMMDGKIAVEKNYGDLPLVECYPGKLNQVFLNVLTNAIHSIQERWRDTHNGKLIITTARNEFDVSISIKDNGMGMTEETKKKLFEPFFTTKEVGVGTGLGLSITWNTIKKHSGQIKVNSELGEGAEFIFTIPIKYTEPQND